KFSWTKKLIRKWFGIKCKSQDIHIHVGDAINEGPGFLSFSPKKGHHHHHHHHHQSANASFSESSRGRAAYLDHPQIINIQNYSLFVSTWNVGGKSPHSHMNLDDWLHSAPPADIYVIGFQEIVPLNAGNILVGEDSGPAKKWLTLIKRTLDDSLPGETTSISGRCPPSPAAKPVAEWNADFEASTGHRAAFFPRRSFQDVSSCAQPRLDRRYSVCERGSDCSGASDHSLGPRVSDYSSSRRASDYSFGQRTSDFSRFGSDEDYLPEDSPRAASFSPDECGAAAAEDGRIAAASGYCLIARKQMVGIFLTVWVRTELREHVRNVKVSCVGTGLMGYLGNKGSISISFVLHRTSLCFVCTHLTSGQREGDELRRNSDFMEILRKTRFPKVDAIDDDEVKSPETILEHDRIIWLGDLNYRIAMPYRSAKALIEMQNWRALLEKDQLRIEQRRGRVFDGWREGKIYFPPTYKYSNNSDRYTGDDDLHPKEKIRTPAWCDRILWYGNGIQQSSYTRGESRFSDHRPVSSTFWIEIESVPANRLRIEVEELMMPYSRGYTELCFF
ncbi:inositol-1,4,5-triphosphate-5-phosphatase, partial [Genlisea aurea]